MDISSYEETESQKKIDEKFADKLGVSAYLWKNIRGLGFTIGGGMIGYFLGKQVSTLNHLEGKTYALGRVNNPLYKAEGYIVPLADAAKYIGAFIGINLGGMVSAYDIWRKREGAQLAVQELTEDMSNMAAIRAKTDPDLVKEMDSLRGMYDELKQENTNLRDKIGEPAKPGAKALERGERSPTGHAEAAETTSEPAR
jgi:hypothetical protein